MKNYSRKVSSNFDNEPFPAHQFNYKITKGLVKRKRVLDIGCWSGQYEKLIVSEAKEVVGIDPEKNAIEYAAKNIKQAKFFVGKAYPLHFSNNSFDVVTLFDVIEHVPENTERKVFVEIYRVLKPGGILVLSTPNKHLVSILMDPAYFMIKHRHYSKDQLQTMLVKTKFRIEKSFTVGGFFLLSTHILELVLKHLFGKNFKHSKSLKKKIGSEYKKGFASVYVIAEKN